MAELRRLLIEQTRLERSVTDHYQLKLTNKENHYLAHVLRLSHGDQLQIVNGGGQLWTATYEKKYLINLNSPLSEPQIVDDKPKRLICLAVVVPKKGFDDILRMSCEIGIDILQPLHSNRSLVSSIKDHRFNRWNQILNESVEQSERLWKPELLGMLSFSEFVKRQNKDSFYAIGVTRTSHAISFESLLKNIPTNLIKLWTVVGPEGGWTPEELELATDMNCIDVEFGKTILKTPTAAIVATQIMLSWKNQLI